MAAFEKGWMSDGQAAGLDRFAEFLKRRVCCKGSGERPVIRRSAGGDEGGGVLYVSIAGVRPR